MNAGVSGDIAVLLIEDDTDSRESFAMYLEVLGFAVLEAADGASALARVASADRIDAIVMDLSLPDTSGEDLARRMRDLPRTRELPIVALTGREPRDDELFTARVTKPADPEKLAETLRKLVASHRASV